jgi:hypothetical protein
MDPKHQENYLKKYDEKSLEKLQSRLVFNDPAYLFIFKKTEKIIAALYLVTNLISDTEPIKWQIRKISLGLMSDTLSLKCVTSVQSKQVIVGLVVIVSEIVSLLKVASVADQISSMNYSVVQRELSLLMNSLHDLHGEMIGGMSLLLPQDFFNVPEPVSNAMRSSVGTIFPTNFSAQQNFPSKGQSRTYNGQKDNQTHQEPKDNLKDSRHIKMLQLLKDGKFLGIRDFAREIKDCSEKTLQRELLSMVEKGVLKKTGERRWSLYSLV